MLLLSVLGVTVLMFALTEGRSLKGHAGVSRQPSVSLANTWSRSYRIGENFTLPCTIFLPPGSEVTSAETLVQFVRLVDDRDTVLSTGKELSRAAARSGHYRVTISKASNNSILATLFITDLTYDDGGRLGCKVGASSYGLTAYTGREIVIHVPITDIHIARLTGNATYERLQDGAILDMQNTYEPIRSGFYCHVTVLGGSIEPKVTVYVDKRDITRSCRRTVLRAWTGTDGKQKRGYLIRFDYVTWHPDRLLLEGSRLLCKASVPLFPALRVAAILNVTYSPQITCDPEKFAEPGDAHVVIKCQAYMNPPPTFAIWWWPSQLTETVIPCGTKHRGLAAEMKKLSRTLYEFRLTVDWVVNAHFHWYTIEVNNGMGIRRRAIQLVQGIDPDRTGSLHGQGNLAAVGVYVVTGYLTHGYGYT